MEGLRADSEAARFIAAALRSEQFTLVDVGCSGGLDSIWDVFGEHLRAYGFDASVEAIQQLNSANSSDRFQFFAGLVGLKLDHPFHKIEPKASLQSRNPWGRLAVARTQAIRVPTHKKTGFTVETSTSFRSFYRAADMLSATTMPCWQHNPVVSHRPGSKSESTCRTSSPNMPCATSIS